MTVATGFDFARGLDCAVGGRSGDLAHPNGIHQCTDRAFIRSEHHPKCLSHSPLACDHTCRLASCWRPAQNRDRRHHQIHIALAVSQCPTARDPWRFLNAGQLSARVFRYCRRVAFGRWLIQKRQNAPVRRLTVNPRLCCARTILQAAKPVIGKAVPPNVTVLATSRKMLWIAGEYVYRVPPLDVPSVDREESGRLSLHCSVLVCVKPALAADRPMCGIVIAARCQMLPSGAWLWPPGLRRHRALQFRSMQRSKARI